MLFSIFPQGFRKNKEKPLFNYSKALADVVFVQDRKRNWRPRDEEEQLPKISSTLQKGILKSWCAGAYSFPFGTLTEEKLNDYKAQLYNKRSQGDLAVYP